MTNSQPTLLSEVFYLAGRLCRYPSSNVNSVYKEGRLLDVCDRHRELVSIGGIRGTWLATCTLFLHFVFSMLGISVGFLLLTLRLLALVSL